MVKKKDSLMRLNGKDQILEYKAQKIAIKIGNSAHVLLPKKLIGKLISIYYKKRDIKK